jgi:hypothetical protein
MFGDVVAEAARLVGERGQFQPAAVVVRGRQAVLGLDVVEDAELHRCLHGSMLESKCRHFNDKHVVFRRSRISPLHFLAHAASA